MEKNPKTPKNPKQVKKEKRGNKLVKEGFWSVSQNIWLCEETSTSRWNFPYKKTPPQSSFKTKKYTH